MTSAWTVADMPDQSGRLAVVTGSNSGLGYEIAAALAARGARVVLACRNVGKGEAAADRIRRTTGAGAGRGPGPVEVRRLDLADLASVAAFGDEMASTEDRLDLLVNNAGLMAIDQERTVDGFEMQLGVNHLGHFALTARLLPLLLRTPGSRVGSMSSFGHRPGRINFDDLMLERRYQRWPAYFQSKLANLLFTLELQRRLAAASAPTIAVAAHPGSSHTDLGTEGSGLSNRVIGPLAPVMTQSAAQGALPMLRAMTDPGARGGEFYGPRWGVAGAPVRETPSRRARNAADARRLWDESVKLTRVDVGALADR